jgi:hypothetical protein
MLTLDLLTKKLPLTPLAQKELKFLSAKNSKGCYFHCLNANVVHTLVDYALIRIFKNTSDGVTYAFLSSAGLRQARLGSASRSLYTCS